MKFNLQQYSSVSEIKKGSKKKKNLLMFICQPTILKHISSDNKNLGTNQNYDNIATTQLSQNIRNSKLLQTQTTANNQNSSKINSSVQVIYGELHQYIDKIDRKINNLLQKQSNEYKIVYQHYYKKFKDQLYQLKEKCFQQEKMFQKNDHVAYLQNQLKVFREEIICCKASCDKLQKENTELKTALDSSKQDSFFLQNNVKNYLKEVKALNLKNNQLENQLYQDKLKEYPFKDTIQSKPNILKKRSHSLNFQLLSQPEIKISFHKYKPNPAHRQMASNRNIYQEFLTDISTKGNKTTSFRSMNNKQGQQLKGQIRYESSPSNKEKYHFKTQVSEKADRNYIVSNISEWFLDCVQTVQKEIYHRKVKNTSCELKRISNGFNGVQSLQDFMKMDKKQVLELFLKSKQVIGIIYHKLKNKKKLTISQDELIYGDNFQENDLSQRKERQQDIQINHFTDKSNEKSNNQPKRNQNRKVMNKTMTQIGSFGHNQHINNKSSSKLNKKNKNQKVNKMSNDYCYQQQRIQTSLLSVSPCYQQKNQTCMKKITAIINHKKNLRLSSHLFTRKKKVSIQ